MRTSSLIISPKQHHKLGSECSNTWACGRHSHSSHHTVWVNVCVCVCAHGDQRRTLGVLSYHFLHYSLEIRSPVGPEARMEVSKSWWSSGLYPWELWSCWQVWPKPAFYRSTRNQIQVLCLPSTWSYPLRLLHSTSFGITFQNFATVQTYFSTLKVTLWVR